MRGYDSQDWYWIVKGNASQAWSSASGAYVAIDEVPEDVTPTRIANEVELYDVLARAGMTAKAPSREFSPAEVRAALLVIDAAVTGDATTPEALATVASQIGFHLPPMRG